MEGTEDDDPHDESTHWLGKIREESLDSHERDTERDTRVGPWAQSFPRKKLGFVPKPLNTLKYGYRDIVIS